MGVPYESFVINLDRQPERYREFCAWNDPVGVTIQRFSAADGKLADEATKRSVAASDSFTNGSIGSALSHKRLWEHCDKLGRPILIFEDDAVLRSDFVSAFAVLMRSIVGFWDFVLFGPNTNAPVVLKASEKLRPMWMEFHPTEAELREFQAWVKPPAAARLSMSFGVGGYLISPRGARRLLSSCLPMDDRSILSPMGNLILVSAIDGMMNFAYGRMDAYISIPPIVWSANDPATSNTLRPKPT